MSKKVGDIHSDFRRLFFLKEGIELAGPRYQNIWILVGIMFVTFLAIGLANGSLEYLQRKMDDPFVNWVSLDVPRGISDKTEKIKKILNEDSIKQGYNYLNVTSNRGFLLRFMSRIDSQSYIVRGRTIETSNPILTEILKSPNLKEGEGFKNDDDYGILVTTDLLKRLGYDNDAAYIQMAFPLLNSKKDALVPIPIAGIVDQLPGKRDFATTPFFYIQRKIGIRSGSPFDPIFTRELLYFIEGDKENAQKARQTLEELVMSGPYDQYKPFVLDVTKGSMTSHKEGYEIGLSFLFDNKDDSETYKIIGSISNFVMRSSTFRGFDPVRYYRFQFKTSKVEDLVSDRLSIHFNELKEIRSFSGYLVSNGFAEQIDPTVSELGLSIDMAQIEEKENYDFITRLTEVISVILIAFSVLSICLFTSHMFRKHLGKISRNIGTFKAFGVDNRILVGIYLSLIFVFLFGSIVVAFLASWIYGILGGGKLLLSLISKLEPGQSYFSLFNRWTLIAIALLLSISMWVLNRTAKSILFKTPGDLIYNRS